MIPINEAVRSDPATGLMRLRFRGDDIEIDLDFASGEDCRVALAALGDYFARRTAPLPAPAPAVDEPEATEPEVSQTRPSASRRHGILVEWFAKQAASVNVAQITEAFPGEWPSAAAVYQFLKEWVARPSCPIERVARGLYRLKGGGAPRVAPTQFRDAGGDAPAARQETDSGQVGANCA